MQVCEIKLALGGGGGGGGGEQCHHFKAEMRTIMVSVGIEWLVPLLLTSTVLVFVISIYIAGKILCIVWHSL